MLTRDALPSLKAGEVDRRFTIQPSRCTLEKRDDGLPRINGYAAVFYNANDDGTTYKIFDDLHERIMPGAFDRAIKEKDDAAALFNHRADNLLGRVSAGTLTLTVDTVGLKYSIDPPDTELGRSVITSIQRGDLQGSSFAFFPDKVVWREEGDILIREIESVKPLVDVGPVTFPAYEATTTEISRSTARAIRERIGAPRLAMAKRKLLVR